MLFRLADTFTAALGRLTNAEQKAVKTTAFDLQTNPASPGLSFHRLDRAKDPNFWSLRVNDDIRIIVHKDGESMLLAYVDHHDDAYRWAERRKLERHPSTGAMQIVEVRERVEEVTTRPPAPAEPPLFRNLRKADLMAFGVPEEWVEDVRAATEANLFDVLAHLPQEAGEALLKLATGESPEPPAPAAQDPFAHPDAARRFRLLANQEELERALDYPWDRWAVFLHPDQRRHVERDYAGPARVSGSAGTGKTIVALHRAVHLARKDEGRVLLTTFSPALANALRGKLDTLAGNEPAVRARVEVAPLSDAVLALHEAWFGAPVIASPEEIAAALGRAAEADASIPTRFLVGEWTDVVDAWQIRDWEAYRDARRLGRKTRLGAKQREALWRVFEDVRADLASAGKVTRADVFGRVTAAIADGREAPWRFAVVDEAQDLGVPEARLLAAIGAGRANALFFAGDLGQRIFQQPFSWKALGIDVRGRSHRLTINYRTSHRIRLHADRLLPPEIADIDQNAEARGGTVSLFDGPPPDIRTFEDAAAEAEAVAAFVRARLAEGMVAREIGVFVRSEDELPRAREAVAAAGAAAATLTAEAEPGEGRVAVGTMHLAKGLEFRAVAVMACDDEVLPLRERVEAIADEGDLDEVYATERHLLYVACTRARERLLVTGVAPASEFLEDMLDV